MTARIDHTVTSGTFTLDGETFDVDNNVWIIGDEHECVVLDAPHDIEPIVELIDGRRVLAVICTHGHDDHVRCAPALAERVNAPIWLHPDELPLWSQTHATQPDGPLAEGQVIEVGGTELRVMVTPGHSPGGVCLYAPELGVLFSGDTLFKGGPGATGRSFSDHDQILVSIRERLFALPDDTIVKTGHGEDTRIGDEKVSLTLP